MTKAPQAVADPDDATPGEVSPTVAATAEAPADTIPKKKRGRPAGSGNAEKSTKGLLGEVEVRLQIKSKTAEGGTYDFDRQGHLVGEVSDCTKQLIGGWFEDWKGAVHPRK